MKEQTKKTYDKPEMKVILCSPMEIICQSALEGDDDTRVDEDDALSDYRNDWGNIW
jgi:hypothetical protein